jgi:hypothetical protein
LGLRTCLKAEINQRCPRMIIYKAIRKCLTFVQFILFRVALCWLSCLELSTYSGRVVLHQVCIMFAQTCCRPGADLIPSWRRSSEQSLVQTRWAGRAQPWRRAGAELALAQSWRRAGADLVQTGRRPGADLAQTWRRPGADLAQAWRGW